MTLCQYDRPASWRILHLILKVFIHNEPKLIIPFYSANAFYGPKYFITEIVYIFGRNLANATFSQNQKLH